MDRIMLEVLGKMRDAYGVLYEATNLIVAHSYGEYEASHKPPCTDDYTTNRVQTIVSLPATAEKTVEKIIEEVKKMILELKIKGSVREHRNGLLKFTSTSLGCVYGRTKEEIEKQLLERIKQLKKSPQKGKTSKPKMKAPFLSEYYKTEYMPYKQHQSLSASTLGNIDRMMKFIVAQKFDKRLTEYTPKMIENFLYTVNETRKRQLLQGLFNNMFTRAIALELISTNPCAAIERMQHKQERGKAFSFDEQADFFALLFNNADIPYERKCYFAFMYLTGTRRNEALSVKAEDVDFKNKVLSIRGTKTEGSNRKIPLTPLLEKLLLSLKVFKGEYFPFSENSVNHIFRDVWDKTKGHKPHDLRHTFGTIQICVEKVDVKTVSLWLGHSTIDTTVNIYTHPEQLDSGTFLRGDIGNDEKTTVYKNKYNGILLLIERFLDCER